MHRKFIAFIVATLLVLTGGGCVVFWFEGSPRFALDETTMIGLAFGVLPLIGGGLLWRYAWRDRKEGGGS